MFIRAKHDRKRQRTQMQIVESLRKGPKVSQRIVAHVGHAPLGDEERIGELRQLAEMMLEKLRDADTRQVPVIAQGSLAQAVEDSRELPRPDRLVDLADCREQARLCLGFRDVAGEMVRLMGWDRILGPHLTVANRILRELVIARIADPKSKRGTVRDFLENCGLGVSLNRVYQSMDYLDEDRIEAIRKRSAESAASVLPEPVSALFYDTTTLYFEGDREDLLAETSPGEEGKVSDGIRRKDYSKDDKPHRVQMVLGLMLTSEGLPVGYRLIPGSPCEGHTLKGAVEETLLAYPDARVTVVADAGLPSEENQSWLQSKDIGYVLGFGMKSARAELRERMLDPEGFEELDSAPSAQGGGRWKIKSLDDGDRRIVVIWSQRRAARHRKQRLEGLGKLRAKLKRSDSPASLTGRGYGRFLKAVGNGVMEVDSDKVREAARWDGLRAIVAHGNAEMSAQDLLERYRQLWHIERGFRTNKRDLRIRPIFHWTPRRIRAHIAICYMAFCTVQHLLHRVRLLGYPMSPQELARALRKVEASVYHSVSDNGTYVAPGCITANARRLYRAVGLSWNPKPWKLRSDSGEAAPDMS